MLINGTEIIGKKVFEYEEIDSTQDEAKRKSKKENIPDGSIFICNNQTSGKGTHGRIWHMSGKENLAFTIVLFPNCNIRYLENVTIKIAECMVNTIEKIYDCHINIKLPNDLIYSNKKLGGILTESVVQNEKVKKIYIGIGMNVAQNEFPDEIKGKAISLKQAFNKEFDKNLILNEFCIQFEDNIYKNIKNKI